MVSFLNYLDWGLLLVASIFMIVMIVRAIVRKRRGKPLSEVWSLSDEGLYLFTYFGFLLIEDLLCCWLRPVSRWGQIGYIVLTLIWIKFIQSWHHRWVKAKTPRPPEGISDNHDSIKW